MLAIFDFDGTLFDSTPEWVRLVEESMLKYGSKEPADFVMYSDLKPLGIHRAAEFLKDKYEWPQSAEEVSREWVYSMRELYADTIPLRKGALEYVKNLKSNGIKICLATAMNNELVEIAIERVGLKNLLDKVVTVFDLNTSKDTTKIYHHCMSLFSENKETTVIYEDSPDVANMCIAEGFRVIGVYDGICESDIELMETVCEGFIYDFRNAVCY